MPRNNELKVRIRQKDYSYTILLGTGLIHKLSEKLRGFSKVAIITDSEVKKFHGSTHLERLRSSGIKAELISFEAGEKSKNRKTKEAIEDELFSLEFRRDSAIVALGGGVVGDITGYVASTYMRGIPYIQYPTTLLAMVDSSIGGKTGINIPYGKNMIGTFYQPSAVYMDMDMLKTLPKEEMINGTVEMVKHAIALDKKFFIFMENSVEKIISLDKETLIKAVYWCTSIKKSIVEKDEKESSLRKVLNLGHTIGHAIESASGYSIKHGQAVALGILAETAMARNLGMVQENDYSRITSLVRKLLLPYKKQPVEKILLNTSADKKNTSDGVKYVLPVGIGNSRIGVRVGSKIAERAIGELM
ncbi:3-dehydroquinate synthase [Candidatus Woesearchaeota archaeon]|nr:3-dehydroquinate synthase [Candidatus Woesearchaeota archaeon]